ncbi:unnamed protein product [Spirodela intermedia]|uniref:Uncharacterized protein n=1 Tax=Spirodela intermedia TaxID=51605 RepID=A0A7I8J072_SPIIN|nr:unnamed protein product [Spirodela intermedia]CAA6663439.1 unnamed protein product [Spirodela intermedia]
MAAEGRALPAAIRFAAAPRRPIPFRSKRLAVLRSDAGGAAASLPSPAPRQADEPSAAEAAGNPNSVISSSSDGSEADPSPGERGVGEDAQTVELQVDGHSFTMEFAESRAVRAEQGDAVGAFLLRSLFLVGFVTLQVACATWFFSSADGKEKRAVDNGAPSAVDNAAVLGQGKEGDLQLGEREVEFRQMVSAIQAMAKEARAAEARKASEKGGDEGPKGDIMEEVNQRVGKVRKRLPRVHRDAKAFGRSPVERGGNKQPKENTRLLTVL